MHDSFPPLGRLERVDLRVAWTSESEDFTPWLAREDNVRLLADAIGLELEVEAQEKAVGPFRADILCKDTGSGHWVLVENQLERTDHIHLGQLLTYAAGLKAVTIVWIARQFTEEHRSALDWLNEITDGRFNFFGLEVELWRIGDSPVAPKFNVVCKPNDWSRTVAESAAQAGRSNTIHLEFWSSFVDHLQQSGSRIRPTKPLPQNWMNIAIGRTGATLVAVASLYDSVKGNYEGHEVRAELVLDGINAKEYFAQLDQVRPEIAAELGYDVNWYNPANRKSAAITVRRSADLNDRSHWPEYHSWLQEKLEDFDRVFRPRVRSLKAPVVQ